MSRLVTLVTGSSTGIGLACALRLGLHASKKYQVYATMRNLDKSKALQEAAGDRFNDTLRVRELDVTSDGSVSDAVQGILDEHGRIDVLVNNAGISTRKPLEYTSMDNIKMVFETNLLGSVRMLKAVLPSMKDRKYGRVVHISSISGVVGIPTFDVYASSKHGAEGLVEALASRMQAFNIRFNTICIAAASSTNMLQNMRRTGLTPMAKELDPITAEHVKTMERRLRHIFRLAVSSEEIAGVIEQAIEDDQSPFRLATCEFMRDIIARKHGDMDGSMFLDFGKLLIGETPSGAVKVQPDILPLSFYYDLYSDDKNKE